jgi:hypothetical protein
VNGRSEWIRTTDPLRDPAGAKQDAKGELTIEELAKLYVERYAKTNRRSWQEDKRRIEQNIIPAIGKHKAAGFSWRAPTVTLRVSRKQRLALNCSLRCAPPSL